VLVSQPFEDPFRGMTLLLAARLVVCQNLIDGPDPCVQLRPPRWLLPPLPWRHRISQHFAHRLARQPELPGRLALAHLIDDDSSPHPRIQLHWVHLSGVPQNTTCCECFDGTSFSAVYFLPAQTPLTRRLLVYFASGAYTAIRLLEGNPSNRPLNHLEPRPRVVAPRCPKHLDSEARMEWRRVVRILLRMRVLTEADEYALANLCQSYSTMVKAQLKLTSTGLLLKTPSGYVQPNPLLSIVGNCMETITKLSREFGLTPASRVRLQAAPPDDDFDPIGAVLAG